MAEAASSGTGGSSENGSKKTDPHAAPATSGPPVELSFARKSVIAVLVMLAAVLLVIFVYRIMPVLVLVFASALMGVLLSAATRLLSQYLRIPRAYALALALLGALAMIGAAAYFITTTIRGQVVELNASVPQAIDSLKGQLDQSDWGKWTREKLNTLPANVAEVFTPDLFWQQGVGLAGSTLGAMGSILIVVVVGVYLAISPETYLKGVAALFPIHARPRVRQILSRIGVTLEWWFFGQALAMLEVFALTSIGLWILGMKCTLALALLAGLFNIIPNFGPILAAIPAVLLAVAPHEGHPTFDFKRAVSVIVLYLIVQMIDAYVVSPWIQKRAIALPAALIMLSQIIAFALLGPMGLLLATPILAAVTVLVKMAYVEDVLGDRPVLAAKPAR
jgi:predicted PurR-regulated permease PerM